MFGLAMRIAFYAPRVSYTDLTRPGGDAIFVHNLIAALRRRGHLVALVSGQDVDGFWRGRIPARRLISETMAIRAQVRSLAPDAWLIYTPSIGYPDLFGWWQRPKQYVLIGADAGRPGTLPNPWRWLFGLAHRHSLARADAIFVYRPKSAVNLRGAGVAPERLRIRPPTPRTWNQVPSREEARTLLGLPQHLPVILCLCRFPKPKPIRRQGKTEMAIDLLAAVSAVRHDVLLVLVGDDGQGQRLVVDEIARLKLENRVRLIPEAERIRLVGSRDNEEVKWFYAACDFYAYPHPHDRPWLSVLEAQACGRPVVAMRTESTELIVDHGRTGLLANDLEQFKQHVEALSSDRTLCQSMGEAAREYIASRHSLESQVEQIEQLLVRNVRAHVSSV